MLWVADAAANTLLKVDPETGALDVVAIFGGVESPLPNANRGDALESDPVPTAVAFDRGGNAYVSLLPGTPFRPGSARVLKVTPDGAVQEWADNLTMLTDLRRGPDGELYAVSYGKFTEQGPVPNSGAIVRVHPGSVSEEVVTGLSFPTSVDFNAEGDAFVTTNGGGPPGVGELRRFDEVAVPPASPPPPEPLRYTRVYTDSSGASHFADAEMVLAAVAVQGASRTMSARPLGGAGSTFFCYEPGTTVDWHPAPRRQFYLIVSGGLDLEVSDGEVRRFGPGDLLLGEATEGPGVRARWSDDGRSCGVMLPLSGPAEP
jgi:quercetin dioxygenase-like cupin family protein